jgi:hypothetical protein
MIDLGIKDIGSIHFSMGQRTYKQADKEMVVKTLKAYKEQNNCSYKHAYEMMVEGNPSYSTYTAWRRKLEAK